MGLPGQHGDPRSVPTCAAPGARLSGTLRPLRGVSWLKGPRSGGGCVTHSRSHKLTVPHCHTRAQVHTHAPTQGGLPGAEWGRAPVSSLFVSEFFFFNFIAVYFHSCDLIVT